MVQEENDGNLLDCCYRKYMKEIRFEYFYICANIIWMIIELNRYKFYVYQ